MKEERLFLVDIHYACFGVVATGDMITHTSPIFSWAIGKTLKEVKPFLVAKNERVVEIKEAPTK